MSLDHRSFRGCGGVSDVSDSFDAVAATASGVSGESETRRGAVSPEKLRIATSLTREDGRYAHHEQRETCQSRGGNPKRTLSETWRIMRLLSARFPPTPSFFLT